MIATDLTLPQFVVALVAMVVAGAIQGSVGFGAAFVAVPALTLINPQALPATLLLMALPMTILMALRERGAIDLPGFVRISVGRVPGTLLGALLLAVVPESSLSVLIGITIAVAVAMSIVAPDFELSAATVLAAGVASGVMATAAAVGGPPLALAYQNRPGPELRSTLALSFVIGSLMSLAGVALAGRLQMWHVELALELLPGLLAGILLSRYVLYYVDRRYLRPAVLSFAAIAAALAIVQGLAA